MFAASHIAAASMFVRDDTVPIDFLTELFGAETEADVRLIYSRWCHRLTGSGHCSFGHPVSASEIELTDISADVEWTARRLFPIKGKVIGQCYQSRESAIINDLVNRPYPGCQILAGQGMKSMLLVPITAQGICFGVLVAAYPTSAAFSHRRLKTIEVIARCLSNHLLLIRKMDQLGILARTDPLTGASNRNHFASLSDQFWTDWTQRGRSFSLASIDIDHFKKINDTLGHAVGDLVLQEVVNRLQRSMRQNDQIVRLGGEEFCVILDGAATSIVEKLANRLHEAVRVTPFGTPGGLVPVTASIGVATVQRCDKDLSVVLARSDKALYKAKQTGRDRVVLAD